jgi:hypothetical protein
MKNTFFETCYTFTEIICVMGFWLKIDGQDFTSHQIQRVSNSTIVEWKNFCGDFCGEFSINKSTQIRGKGFGLKFKNVC